jgi:hypothetical protein
MDYGLRLTVYGLRFRVFGLRFTAWGVRWVGEHIVLLVPYIVDMETARARTSRVYGERKGSRVSDGGTTAPS